MNFDFLKKIKAGWGWARFIWGVLGALGATAGITGVAVAVGGAIWAIILGVPIPVAIMAGFCSFVGTVYLTLMPWAWRTGSVKLHDCGAISSQHPITPRPRLHLGKLH
jgi:hypothetical protein